MINLEIDKIFLFIKRIRIRHIIIIILSCVIFSAIFLTLQKLLIPNKYIARTTIVVMHKENNSGYGLLSASHYLADSFSNAYYNNQVAQYTADEIGNGITKEQVLNNINVKRKEKTLLIKIYGTGYTEENAILLSKTYAKGLELHLAESFSLNSIVVVEEPDDVVIVSKSKYALLAGFTVGFIVACIFIYVKHISSRRIWNANVTDKLKISFLGTAYVDK